MHAYPITRADESQTTMSQKQARVVMVSFPTQGHIAPLMKLSHRIADRGFRVTFVNTEAAHKQLQRASSSDQKGIDLVCVPDGLEGDEERRNPLKLASSVTEAVPGHLRALMEQMINGSDDDRIGCVVADLSVWKALEVAKSMGIKGVGVWFSGAATLAFTLSIPKLINDGLIDVNGNLIKDNGEIKISEEIPPWKGSEISWNHPSNKHLQSIIFRFVSANVQALKLCTSVLCNFFSELDPPSSSLLPQILPIGPLLLAHTTNPATIWPEDSNSLAWLDRQPPDSVIYVAFGSITALTQQQLHELACGLELTRRPFLWVIRPDHDHASSIKQASRTIETAQDQGRLSDMGKIVRWAPQERVLAHPSVGVFLTHCGWNSIMEGLSGGVRFLCWPGFGDQWHNSKYLCDVWKVGLGLDVGEDGVVARDETRVKVDMLYGCRGIKENAMRLREKAIVSVGQGGSSAANFESFIQNISK